MKHAVIVIRVHRKDQTPLFEVRKAGGRPGLFLDPLQRRHQYGQQQRNNRYYNQKFDEREPFFCINLLFCSQIRVSFGRVKLGRL